MARALDDIIADIEVITQRLESLDKRVKTIEIATEGAGLQVENIEKELGRGGSRRRRTFRRRNRNS